MSGVAGASGNSRAVASESLVPAALSESFRPNHFVRVIRPGYLVRVGSPANRPPVPSVLPPVRRPRPRPRLGTGA